MILFVFEGVKRESKEDILQDKIFNSQLEQYVNTEYSMLSRYFCLTISNDICDTSDTYDTCFLKLSSRGRAGKIFQKSFPPAYVREFF